MTTIAADRKQYMWLPSVTLWQREMVRFYRQKSRVIGVVASPLVFWFFLGSGFGSSFAASSSTGHSVNYLEYFFPGTIILTILFTAIFSTMSIIEDRHEGFLQSVLVAPVSRGSIVMGKMLGGASLAFFQAVFFLALAPLVGISLNIESFLITAVIEFIIAFGLTGLGFAIAWKMDSTQGFHAIMNLFLVPMWLLSGSVFPIEGTPMWLHVIMSINPLTYGTNALRDGMYLASSGSVGSLLFPAMLTVVFAASTFFLSVLLAWKRS
ncbi:MAG TPA: ABC transporter permease [Candidatus Kapabacteria bacterium]|nr:ABC transporter permease [Candidatus Kapabacteria bacterium]